MELIGKLCNKFGVLLHSVNLISICAQYEILKAQLNILESRPHNFLCLGSLFVEKIKENNNLLHEVEPSLLFSRAYEVHGVCTRTALDQWFSTIFVQRTAKFLK